MAVVSESYTKSEPVSNHNSQHKHHHIRLLQRQDVPSGEEDVGDEELDPRIQIELEKLNRASEEINRLELELDDARAAFRQVLSDSSQCLNGLAKKLGTCVDKARPYYDAKVRLREAQQESQKAVLMFERSCSMHEAAKEMVQLAEDGYKRRECSLAPTWQEMLNHATVKVNEAEKERTESEEYHQRATLRFQHTQEEVLKFQADLKKVITKSKIARQSERSWLNSGDRQERRNYHRATATSCVRNVKELFEHKLGLSVTSEPTFTHRNEKLWTCRNKVVIFTTVMDELQMVYFEVKTKFSQVLEEHKNSVSRLEDEVSSAKALYAQALCSLEAISDDIHRHRLEQGQKLLLGIREAGVGAESPLLCQEWTKGVKIEGSASTGIVGDEANECPINVLDVNQLKLHKHTGISYFEAASHRKTSPQERHAVDGILKTDALDTVVFKTSLSDLQTISCSQTFQPVLNHQIQAETVRTYIHHATGKTPNENTPRYLEADPGHRYIYPTPDPGVSIEMAYQEFGDNSFGPPRKDESLSELVELQNVGSSPLDINCPQQFANSSQSLQHQSVTISSQVAQRSPTEFQHRPTLVLQSPTQIQNLPTQVQNPPTQVQNALTQVQNPPTQVQNAPTQVQNPPTQVQNAPTQVQYPPTQVQNAPTQVQNPPTQVQNAPTQVQYPPTQVQNAPTQVQNAPIQVHNTSTQIQHPPTQVHNTSTTADQSPKQLGPSSTQHSPTPIQHPTIQHTPTLVPQATHRKPPRLQGLILQVGANTANLSATHLSVRPSIYPHYQQNSKVHISTHHPLLGIFLERPLQSHPPV